MNTKEQKLVELLKSMQKKYGVLGVKAEFESEGARLEELMRLKDIASRAGVILALKIGGPEDVWGIHQARRIGVHEIVAPMVESSYALKKFLEAFEKHVPKSERDDVVAAVNIETAQSYADIDRIIEIGKAKGLHGITVGRVDLAGSLGLDRNLIDSPKICEITESVCKKARVAGLRTVIGGAIENGSRTFIKKLVDANLLDRFETRKIIFGAAHAMANYEDAVKDAHRFEKGWLENKQDHYNAILAEDAERIPMLKNRIGE